MKKICNVHIFFLKFRGFLDLYGVYNSMEISKEKKKDISYILGKNIVLDANQIDIVTSNFKHMMVYAGAGCGKTTTIVARVKFLITVKKVNPHLIVILSYTNKAVEEIKNKLSQVLSVKVEVMTFHKFALALYKNKNIPIFTDLKGWLRYYINEQLKSASIRRKYVFLFRSYFKGPSYLLYIVSLSFYNRFISNSKNLCYEPLLRLLETTIIYIKQNHYKQDDWDTLREKIKRSKKKYLKVIVLEDIYKQYLNYLDWNHLMDFEDIITKGRSFISEQKKGFSYLIVDEYQDISRNRFILFKDYVTKFNCNTMVVGDDFQSIFAFTGSQLSYFTQYTKHMKSVKEFYITKTYRNSQELIDIAGQFIMKNKEQINKYLVSSKHCQDPIIVLYYKNKRKALEACVQEIVKQYGEKVNIMLLGRYKHDLHFLMESSSFIVNKESRITYLKRKEVSIRFFTVHGAKGLESDVVIVLNMTSDTYGFPSEVSSCFPFLYPILRYPYEEERRLFYVALTRTKNKVYLLTPFHRKSIFIQELERDYPTQICYRTNS